MRKSSTLENWFIITIFMNNIRRYLPAGAIILVAAIVLIALVKNFSPEEQRNLELNEGTTDSSQEIQNRESEKDLHGRITSEPIRVAKFGWKPIAKTIPVAGYIWEWAVEVTNLTPVTITVQITYELKDENQVVVAKGIGGDNLLPYETKIIIGRASSDESIERARKQSVKVMSSPSSGKEEIINIWTWPDPYVVKVGSIN